MIFFRNYTIDSSIAPPCPAVYTYTPHFQVPGGNYTYFRLLLNYPGMDVRVSVTPITGDPGESLSVALYILRVLSQTTWRVV